MAADAIRFLRSFWDLIDFKSAQKEHDKLFFWVVAPASRTVLQLLLVQLKVSGLRFRSRSMQSMPHHCLAILKAESVHANASARPG